LNSRQAFYRLSQASSRNDLFLFVNLSYSLRLLSLFISSIELLLRNMHISTKTF
jgi:hypothetical protein